MKAHTKKVLLCGTYYGQVYLPAIFQEKGVELIGILALGSDRSVRLSEQHGVPLYTDIDDVHDDIDIACVALNQDIAIPIAKALLNRGANLLIEHPVNITNINALLNHPRHSDQRIHINGHFSYLPPIADFIQLFRKLNHASQANILTIQCNSRTLFSTIDILMLSFAHFDMYNLRITPMGQYTHCTFQIGPVPVSLTYQKWRHENDDSTDSPLGHQITATYPEGVLYLGGTFGPCLWSPLISNETPTALSLYQSCHPLKDDTDNQRAGATNGLFNNIDITTMIRWRKQANQQAIRELISYDSHSPLRHSEDYIRNICKHWTELFSLLGTDSRSSDASEKRHAFTTDHILNM